MQGVCKCWLRKVTHCERFAWLKAYKLLAVFLLSLSFSLIFIFSARLSCCFWKFNFYCRWYFFLWCRIHSWSCYLRREFISLFASMLQSVSHSPVRDASECSMEVWKYSMSFLIARIRCKCALIKEWCDCARRRPTTTVAWHSSETSFDKFMFTIIKNRNVEIFINLHGPHNWCAQPARGLTICRIYVRTRTRTQLLS